MQVNSTTNSYHFDLLFSQHSSSEKACDVKPPRIEKNQSNSSHIMPDELLRKMLSQSSGGTSASVLNLSLSTIKTANGVPAPDSEIPQGAQRSQANVPIVNDSVARSRDELREILSELIKQYRLSESDKQKSWEKLNGFEKGVVTLEAWFTGVWEGVEGIGTLVWEGGKLLAQGQTAALRAGAEVGQFSGQLLLNLAAGDWDKVDVQLADAQHRIESAAMMLGEQGLAFIRGLEILSRLAQDGETREILQQFAGSAWEATSTASLTTGGVVLVIDVILAIGTAGAFAAGKGATYAGKGAATSARLIENLQEVVSKLADNVNETNPVSVRRKLDTGGNDVRSEMVAPGIGTSQIDGVISEVNRNADIATELTRRAIIRGRVTDSAQAFGTRAHLLFEGLNDRLNRRLIDQGSPFRVDTEVFRDATGGLTARRAKNSIGVDAISRNTDDASSVRVLDLKTHGGTERPISAARQAEIKLRFGVQAEEIYRAR